MSSSHYLNYPKGDFPIYLAYGFCPIFFFSCSIYCIKHYFMGFCFAGYINLPIENSLNWHIYEMILELELL